MVYDAEVSEFIFNQDPKLKHQVTGIKIKGSDEVIACDAVVICAGPYLARMMKKHFGLSCPMMPIKGYSFDIPINNYEEIN